MMSIEESLHRRRAIQTQRGRKTRKLGGMLAAEVLDYIVHSGLLWRLRPDGG
jgi:hypothetical protein